MAKKPKTAERAVVDPLAVYYNGQDYLLAGSRCFPQAEIGPGTYESLLRPASVIFCLGAEILMRYDSKLWMGSLIEGAAYLPE